MFLSKVIIQPPIWIYLEGALFVAPNKYRLTMDISIMYIYIHTYIYIYVCVCVIKNPREHRQIDRLLDLFWAADCRSPASCSGWAPRQRPLHQLQFPIHGDRLIQWS